MTLSEQVDRALLINQRARNALLAQVDALTADIAILQQFQVELAKPTVPRALLEKLLAVLGKE